MIRILPLLFVLGAGWWCLRWLRRQPPARRAQIQRGALISVLLVLCILLPLSGRASWLLAALAAAVPLLLRFTQIKSLLDRLLHRPDRPTGPQAGTVSRNGSMSRDEAYQVLDLQPSASRDEVIEAHRRLIQKLHPDRGGSAYLATRINCAKDILLSEWKLG